MNSIGHSRLCLSVEKIIWIFLQLDFKWMTRKWHSQVLLLLHQMCDKKSWALHVIFGSLSDFVPCKWVSAHCAAGLHVTLVANLPSFKRTHKGVSKMETGQSSSTEIRAKGRREKPSGRLQLHFYDSHGGKVWKPFCSHYSTKTSADDPCLC